MLIWEVFGMSLLIGYVIGIIMGGAVEAHDKNKEIAQLNEDLKWAYHEADQAREMLWNLHLADTQANPSRLAKN